MREKAACSKTTPLFSPRLPYSCAASSRTGAASSRIYDSPWQPFAFWPSRPAPTHHPLFTHHERTPPDTFFPRYDILLPAGIRPSRRRGHWLQHERRHHAQTRTCRLAVSPDTRTPSATRSRHPHPRKMYGYDCAMCHGETGNGKGELSAGMNLKDYTDPAALHDFTDGQLFYIIQNGRGQMPAEAGRQNEQEIWNMVILVRSFAHK